MLDTNQKLERIENNIQALLGLFNSLQSENEQLKKDNNELKFKLRENTDKISGLEEQIESQIIVNAISSQKTNIDNVDAKKTIDALLSEIDHCIAALNKS